MVHVGRAPSVWLGVAPLCLVQYVDVLGVTVVVTALPAMLDGLRAPADAASLVSTGYAMFFGGLLMLGARLGDRFGHRRIIFTGLVIFAAAVPGPGSPVPAVAWGLAAVIGVTGAIAFGFVGSAAPEPEPQPRQNADQGLFEQRR
jgi:MFS family permease